LKPSVQRRRDTLTVLVPAGIRQSSEWRPRSNVDVDRATAERSQTYRLNPATIAPAESYWSSAPT